MTGLPTSVLAGALAAASTALATVWLARLAPRLGWTDRPEAAGPGTAGTGTAGRKRQRRPVPPVGGAAILLGLSVGGLAAGWQAPFGIAGGPALATLALAFLAGTLDDLVPLRPRAKLGAQLAAGLPLALAAAQRFADSAPLAFVLALLALVCAVNLANTFDHADGLLAGSAALGLAWGGPGWAAAAVAGFLPFNLDARRGPLPAPGGEPGPAVGDPGARADDRDERDERGQPGTEEPPTAYLGDAGSHLLGVALLLTPAAWPALALAAADLLRLAFVRLRAGSRPWIGDRRHVGHRLSCSRSPRAVAAWVLAVQVPLLAWWQAPPGLAAPWRLFLGGALALAVLLLVARRGAAARAGGGTRGRRGAGRPCPLPPGAE